jgi:hypothetical protein
MGHMRTVRDVQYLKEGEEYWPAYAGEYTGVDDKRYFLDNPGAETIAALYNLKAVELQFEFFCFATLWKYRDIIMLPNRNNEHKLALSRYFELRDKFEAPWYQQAKHVIPIESPRMLPFTDRGDFDLEEMTKVFDEYADCSFLIYRVPLYDDPKWSRTSDILTPLKSDRAPETNSYV